MRKETRQILLVTAILLLATLACQTLMAGNNASLGVTTTQEPLAAPTKAPEEPVEEATSAVAEKTDEPEIEELPENKEPADLDAPFPLPPDVESFDTLADEHINFQTSMSIDEAIAFYRAELGGQGLSERDLLTVISETAFSMVFDGSVNGKALVIQGVLFEPGSLNINIRYEDV